MIKFLLFLAILVFLYYFVLWLLKLHVLRFLKQFTPPPSSHSTLPESEKLIACHTCQTYIPLAQATEKEGYYYCQEHAPT